MSDFQFDPNNVDPNNLPGNTPTDAVPTQPGTTVPENATPATQTPTNQPQPDSTATTQTVTTNLQTSVAKPELPPGTTVTPTTQVIDPNAQIKSGTGQMGSTVPVTGQQGTAQQVTTAAVAQPVNLGPAAQVDVATVGAQTPQMQAQQGQISSQAQVQAQTQEGLSPELQKAFKDFESDLAAIGVDPRATVQEQYTKLMDFGPGDIPPWAKGAYRKAEQIMAARGLGSSTVAGETITTALMQAAMPIAVQDAKVFETMSLTKLDKKAQGAFLRAGYIANLDMANLNNRQQAAVINAQSFLAMDMKNLDNRQQSAIINTQSRLQTLLADQAAINSARQFNATSDNQMRQFYADMGTRVSTFNAEQNNAMQQFNASSANQMTQFNVGQNNALAQFNASIANDRDKFNANNSLIIEQSNVNYLRGINNQNNALTNQAGIINSQNLLNISNTAMANMVQLLRDQTVFNFQSGENGKDRAANMMLQQMQNQEWYKRFNTQQKSSFWSSVGNFVFGVAADAVGGMDWGNIFGNSSSDGGGNTDAGYFGGYTG